MSGEARLSDADLHGFVDEALDEVRSAEIEAMSARDPMLAARIAQFRADKALLKEVYGPLNERPIPDAWLEALRQPPREPHTPVSWRWAASIAAALIVAVIGTLAWINQPRSISGDVVEAALAARLSSASAESVVAVGSGTNPHAYDHLLSTTVAMKISVPDMRRWGYRLARVDLYPAASGAGSAELSYRDAANRLFTLYVRRSNGKVRFDQFERAGLRVCIWQDDALSMVMAGNVSTAAMQRLASLAYSGLTAG